MLRQTAGKESREKEGRTKRNREEKKRQECQLLVVGCVEVLHTEATHRQTEREVRKEEKYTRVREEIRFFTRGIGGILFRVDGQAETEMQGSHWGESPFVFVSAILSSQGDQS